MTVVRCLAYQKRLALSCPQNIPHIAEHLFGRLRIGRWQRFLNGPQNRVVLSLQAAISLFDRELDIGWD